MQYKTIILELLQQRPQMHEQLRKERKLMPALDLFARELRRNHQTWQEMLSQLYPGSDPRQISSQAMELAVKEMEDHLPSASAAAGTLSLDEAMAFIQRRMSRG